MKIYSYNPNYHILRDESYPEIIQDIIFAMEEMKLMHEILS